MATRQSFALVLFVAALGSSISAHAIITGNGAALNGTSRNGGGENGISNNGMRFNGGGDNGLKINGLSSKGRDVNSIDRNARGAAQVDQRREPPPPPSAPMIRLPDGTTFSIEEADRNDAAGRRPAAP